MKKRDMTELRLRAREEKLQARADWHLEQVKGDIDYLRTDGVKIIGNQVAQDLAAKSPIIAKAINYITGNKNSNQESKRSVLGRITGGGSSSSSRDSARLNNLLSLNGIKAAILPTLYTLGSMKLLSYSLKGARNLLKSGAKSLFGRGKSKKR